MTNYLKFLLFFAVLDLSKAEIKFSDGPEGILNNFENVSVCATLEERLYKLAKQRLADLNYEKYVLERYIKDYEESSGVVPQGGSYVASSGILSYRMVHRFTHHLRELRRLLLNQSELKNMLLNHEDWPVKQDLDNTMRAFYEIQNVLDIPLAKLPAVLSGGMQIVELTALQISEIAMYCLKSKAYDFAIEWLEWSKSKLENGDASISLRIINQRLNKAVTLHNEALKNSPNTHLDLFEESVSIGQKNRLKRRTLYFEDTKSFDDPSAIMPNFWALCAGEKLQSDFEKSKLFCYYDKSVHIFWLINPLKIEQLSSNAIQIYDVIGENEIQTIIANKDKLRSDKVDSELKQDWAEIDYLPELSKKVELLTGLKLSGKNVSVPIRSVEYVVGRMGDISSLPHKDPAKEDSEGIGGNVVATILFYLNNVEIGGQTAFSMLKTRASPIKGSAVFWYNMFRNGNIMDNSWHASCPVQYGYKLSIQKFLRYNAQFQTYKCSLNPNE